MRLPWRRTPATAAAEREVLPLGFSDYLSMFNLGGLSYPFGYKQTIQGDREEISGTFTGLVAGAYQSNGVVFACGLVRLLLFTEARFQFRRIRSGRPGALYGSPALGILEDPWPGGTTGDLLARMEQDVTLAGNAFVARRGDMLRRMRPDWTQIILGSMDDPDVEAGDLDAVVLGYAYQPGGPGGGKPAELLTRDQVAHYAPVPDPSASFRGMSWLAPIIREIQGDTAATVHKLKFFEQGATPNTIVKLPPEIRQETFENWVKLFQADHDGVANAYKTIFLGGGADVLVVGANLRQLDFKATQGAGETRIAAAAGVPPIIVGLSEGLASSTYSNYSQAKRRLADGTMRPLWRNAAGSLATLVDVPADSELWYDDRDIQFLAEDEKDSADILQTQANAIRTLTDAGYTAESVVSAVNSDDLNLLVHSGLFSVQLQPPGTVAAPVPQSQTAPAPPNGKPAMPAAAPAGGDDEED